MSTTATTTDGIIRIFVADGTIHGIPAGMIRGITAAGIAPGTIAVGIIHGIMAEDGTTRGITAAGMADTAAIMAVGIARIMEDMEEDTILPVEIITATADKAIRWADAIQCAQAIILRGEVPLAPT